MHGRRVPCQPGYLIHTGIQKEEGVAGGGRGGQSEVVGGAAACPPPSTSAGIRNRKLQVNPFPRAICVSSCAAWGRASHPAVPGADRWATAIRMGECQGHSGCVWCTECMRLFYGCFLWFQRRGPLERAACAACGAVLYTTERWE